MMIYLIGCDVMISLLAPSRFVHRHLHACMYICDVVLFVCTQKSLCMRILSSLYVVMKVFLR